MWHSSHAGSRGGVTQALSVKTSALLYQLQTEIVLKLSDQVLKVKTGALRSFVNVKGPTEAGGIISGGVGIPAGQTRPYALAHELGHSTPYQITPVRARPLAFQMSTKATARTIFRNMWCTHQFRRGRSFIPFWKKIAAKLFSNAPTKSRVRAEKNDAMKTFGKSRIQFQLFV
jgi:hypothetical protein